MYEGRDSPITSTEGTARPQTYRVTADLDPSPSEQLIFMITPSLQFPCVCECVCVGGGPRLQKMSASSSVTHHLPPPPNLPEATPGRAILWTGHPRECWPSLVSSRGGPCSALPPACPAPSLSPSWTQALLFHSAVLSSPQMSLTASPASLLVGLHGPACLFPRLPASLSSAII